MLVSPMMRETRVSRERESVPRVSQGCTHWQECTDGRKAAPGPLPLLDEKGGKPLTTRGRYREGYRDADAGTAESRQQWRRYSYRAVAPQLGHRPVRGV
jgi:hypothetical protein